MTPHDFTTAQAQAPERKCSECGNGEADLSLYCVRCLNNDGWHLIDLNQAGEGDAVAVRFGWDGEGYQYMDNGSGSDWKTRIPDAELLYAHPQPAQAQAVDGEAVELPEIYEQYRTWPEDIKRKLSLHDLRRMTGWKLHCCNPFQTVNQQLLDDIVNLLIAARGAIKLGSDVNATNYISAAIAAAQVQGGGE